MTDWDGKERERNREMGRSEAERTTERRAGDWDRGRGLMESGVQTRHLPRPVEGPGPIISPSSPQGPGQCPQAQVPDPDS